MRRIRFSIYSDVSKQRDEYRMQRFNEQLQKASRGKNLKWTIEKKMLRGETV